MIDITVLQKTETPVVSKEHFDKWLKPLDTHEKNFVSSDETYDHEIYERIGYIIASIWKEFDVNLNGWVFSNNHFCYYDEDEEWEYFNPIGFFDSESMLDSISYETQDIILTNWRHNRQQHKNGIAYNGKFEKSFPTHWLYTNFENELREHVEEWKRDNPQKINFKKG